MTVHFALQTSRHPHGSRAALVLLAALAVVGSVGNAAEGAGKDEPRVVDQGELERALAAPKTNGTGRTRGLRIAPRPEPLAAGDGGGGTGASDAAAAATATATATATTTTTATTTEGDALGASSVALDIPFELNSSALRPAATAQLRQLAAALQSESLTPYRFLIAGHTDASGDADYNRRLSGRRAETVRRSLIDAGIDPKRLDARGFGEDELLDPANPRSGANRRVEIRNLGTAQP